MKSFFKKILLILLILTTILNITITILFSYYWNKTKLTDLSSLVPNGNTVIYDQDGNMLANLSAEYTAYVPYSEIPQVMIDAMIAIEDSRFFSHEGLDYQGILRAIINNLKAKGYKEGASTITQQLVKNVYLSNEKTLDRKITEAILSLKLEKVLTKEDILASYLSNILFGGKIYGIKMAAKYYFDIPVSEITLKEASFLAGLVQMPNYYNPFTNYEEALKRRNIVLLRMFEENYITENDFVDTKNIPLNTYLKKGNINENLGIYASYIDYVMTEASNLYGKNLYNEVIEIYVTMNPKIQFEISNIMNNVYQTFNDDEMECGIVVLENQTGHILGIGGTRKAGLRNLNYATEVFLQPGSTIKPILDYGPIIEYEKYSPLYQILDEPYTYPSGETVKNWDYQYKGNISLRKALVESRNIPAIKLYKLVGDEKAWQFANRLGIHSRDSFYHESMAIGGFEIGYTVLEMANAYQAFANMGTFCQASAIDKIKQNGQIEFYEPKKTYAMEQTTAFLINDMLHGVLKNTNYDLKNTFLSAKTGQSNYDSITRNKYGIPESATKDSWAIGYTKDLTVAVWCGYGSIAEGHYLNRITKNIPLTIMHQLLEKFAKEKQFYEMPIELTIKKVEVIAGKLYEPLENSTKYNQDYFFEGFIPLSRLDLDLTKL